MRLTIFAAMFVALCVMFAQTKTLASDTKALEPGMPAPAFDLAQVAGKTMKSADLDGNVVVVDLLATWCDPCVQEIPNFNALSEKYKGKKVRVIGIALASGSAAEVQAKVAEFKVKYPVLLGTDKVMSDF